ncbi:MAG: CRISPR-associated protein Crm3 [Polyangiaceae bacterium]|nr:CRISPR-associated protein Crm3 [Polyangiaceae bacterium]
MRLAIVPRDGMFFKDGRGWYASASGRGHAVPWPFPSTLLGAVRTAWGRAVEAADGQVLSPSDWRERTMDISLGAVIALRRPRGEPWSPSHRMWAVPADALHTDASREVHRLEPIRREIRTLGRGDDSAREALWRPEVPRGKPGPLPSFWTDEELSRWLSGRAVAVLSAEAREARALRERVDVRIQIDSKTGTVSDGALFATETIETLQREGEDLFEWAIGVEARLPEESSGLARLFTLGSDRRLATWEALPDTLVAPPAGLDFTEAPGLRVIAATPLCFSAGWLPDGFAARGEEYRGRLAGVEGELILRAAFVPRAAHVSGWDMVARQPKATRRLVPSGAVYFFQKVAGSPFTATETAGLWLHAVGQHGNEGFGRVIAGPWEVRR